VPHLTSRHESVVGIRDVTSRIPNPGNV